MLTNSCRKPICAVLVLFEHKYNSPYFQNNACSRPSTVSLVEQRIPSRFHTRNVLAPTVPKGLSPYITQWTWKQIKNMIIKWWAFQWQPLMVFMEFMGLSLIRSQKTYLNQFPFAERVWHVHKPVFGWIALTTKNCPSPRQLILGILSSHSAAGLAVYITTMTSIISQ